MKLGVRSPLLSLLFLGAGLSRVAAQTGLLIVAHGGGPQWNAGVRGLVDQVRWSEGPVAVAFLMGAEAASQGWEPAVAKLVREGARAIVAVPLMVSSYGGHYHQIRWYAGELDSLPGDHAHHAPQRPAAPPVPIRVTPALDDAAELGAALLEGWRSLARTDRRGALVLVAHGPNTDTEAARWIRNLELAAEQLRAAEGLSVSVGLLRDDAPAAVRAAAVAELRATVERHAAATRDSVTVLPVLISTGTIDQVKIPADLAGLPIRYVSAALVQSSALARWVERIARDAPAPSTP